MKYFVIFVSGLLMSLILTPVLIPLLKKMKFGQSIREIGPSWHNKKTGTPTMGGVAFIIATTATLLIFGGFNNSKMLFVLFSSLSFGLIGFLDDYIKIVLKRNLGLKAYQKFGLQLVVSLLFTYYGYSTGVLTADVLIPFTSTTVDFGMFYVPFIIFINLAAVNSVNLTDGIDGLATSVTIAVLIYFVADTLLSKIDNPFPFALIGSLIGFLVFNAYPAKVFMGDTGSLYLGGAIAGLAVVTGNPLILIVVGGVYIVETASVIIQVVSFKITGKRVFKMSPIHHHFEMSGWSEVKIVCIFTGITLVLVMLSLLTMGL